MKQNKYDDPSFFEQYSQMPRSIGGLQAAGEWHVLRDMLPNLENAAVLDLGCGFGWHCRYAVSEKAGRVVGVDISARMLARAREITTEPNIEYRQLAIEDIDFLPGTFNVVLSSLALHYIADYVQVCRKVFDCLQPGGAFVLSVEHPIFTALAAQDWYCDAAGNRLHWPVDHYQEEGLRHTRFLENDVIKYHRTVTTWINTLLQTGFQLQRVEEPAPTASIIAQYPGMKDETRRPIFLLLSVIKPAV
ncbi:class I SAM-dependent methyltransferase [Chitinophaga sp. Ak27]|uniref:class I SAM-dependent methyltransferase n=1 Tax=Chitinophaga sp. Ak27 TaxID=2726116 RepID=UPI00145EB44C|nr:class I SAM-dependent methyltransferase [Chitinophaga sp. Ak27]NLU91516.1 class I SAM-dependent methyltransferase [Chitinophaga sp. Ak27]